LTATEPGKKEPGDFGRNHDGPLIMVTLVDGVPHYTYEDGSPVSLREKGDSGARHFKKLVAEGWLVPEKGDSLLEGGPPQRYRTRSL
jgi:hypothetical protein